MSEVIDIDDLADPRIEEYRSVRERDLLGVDGHRGLFVAESMLVIERMLAIPGMAKSALVESRHARPMREMLDATGHQHVQLFVARDVVLRAIAGFNVHRGALALGVRPSADRTTLAAVIPRAARATLLLAEEVTHPDNVGSLFRNAAAFGVDAVVLSPRSHDHLYRKCIRVSMGHALRIPAARSVDWLADLRRLKSEWRFTIVAATLSRDAIAIDDVEVPERVALLVGNEFDGLSQAAAATADIRVRIPMAPQGDSLNVATAAAVCLHRLSQGLRQ